MTDLRSLGLSPDQIEQLKRIKALAEGMTDSHRIEEAYEKYAKALAGITRGVGVTDNLKALAEQASRVYPEEALDRLIEAIQNEVGPVSLRQRLWWHILDALDFIRRLFSAIYDNSGEMVDPENYGNHF